VTQDENKCQHCSKTFTTHASLARHTKQWCKVLKTSQNAEFDETRMIEKLLKNQASQNKIVEKFQDQMSSMFEKLQRFESQEQVMAIRPHSAVYNHSFIDENVKDPPLETDFQQQQQPIETRAKTKAVRTRKITTTIAEERIEVEITPWDDTTPIVVTTQQMKEAFAENPRLREYASLRGDEFTNPEIAPKYVSELMVDLIRRGHQDPAARNIRLNPSRSDQVLVKAGETRDNWEARELSVASRSLLEAISVAIRNATLRDDERKQLESEVQHALAVARLLYCETPDQYAQSIRKPLEVHLANMTLRLTKAVASNQNR
jgi:uncharacterized coiled-coil protein SlyX